MWEWMNKRIWLYVEGDLNTANHKKQQTIAYYNQ